MNGNPLINEPCSAHVICRSSLRSSTHVICRSSLRSKTRVLDRSSLRSSTHVICRSSFKSGRMDFTATGVPRHMTRRISPNAPWQEDGTGDRETARKDNQVVCDEQAAINSSPWTTSHHGQDYSIR